MIVYRKTKPVYDHDVFVAITVHLCHLVFSFFMQTCARNYYYTCKSDRSTLARIIAQKVSLTH